MKTLLLLVLSLLLVACGQKKSGGKVNQIFVKGNPLTMVSETVQNKTSFITTANANDFQGYALSSLYIFTEKEFLTQRESDDIEDGQEADEDDQTSGGHPVYDLSVGTDTLRLESDAQKLALEFKKKDDAYQLKTLEIAREAYAVSVEHYSISPDKSKMSFLLSLKTKDDGRVLLSIAFYKKGAERLAARASSQYKYLFGAGVKIPWRKDAKKIDVTLCSSLTRQHPSTKLANSVKLWQEPLTEAHIDQTINVTVSYSCRPFSDVNEHAIHFVSDYLTIKRRDQSNPAFTMVHPDYASKEIFDADIIFLGAEIEKGGELSDLYWQRYVAHEFGHFLGLDHMFEGRPSIMSYEDVFSLRTYDEDALVELYR